MGDPLASESRLDDIRSLRQAAEVAEDSHTTGAGPFEAFTLRQLYDVEPQPLLVESLLSPGHHGMFYGAPGSGKTFAIIDLMVRGALGLPIFGKLGVQRPFKSLLCAAEGTLDKLGSRFITTAAHHGLDLDSDMIRLIPDVPALFQPRESEGGLAQFLLALEDLEREGFRPDLIIFDTQSDLVIGGDDNSNADASIVLENLRTIRESSSAATANIHHPTKDGAHYRGAAVWRQKCDFIVEITGSDNPRIVRCDKLKDGEKFKPIAGKLVSTPDPRYPCNDKLNSAVFDWIEATPRPTSAQQERANNQKNVIALLREEHSGSGAKNSPPSNAVSYPALAKAIGLSPNPVQKILNQLSDDPATGVRRGRTKSGAVFWWDETWRDETR